MSTNGDITAHTLTHTHTHTHTQLQEYIPNIAASGAQLQPNGRVRIEQVMY
jgi:hypothetical protein